MHKSLGLSRVTQSPPPSLTIIKRLIYVGRTDCRKGKRVVFTYRRSEAGEKMVSTYDREQKDSWTDQVSGPFPVVCDCHVCIANSKRAAIFIPLFFFIIIIILFPWKRLISWPRFFFHLRNDFLTFYGTGSRDGIRSFPSPPHHPRFSVRAGI